MNYLCREVCSQGLRRQPSHGANQLVNAVRRTDSSQLLLSCDSVGSDAAIYRDSNLDVLYRLKAFLSVLCIPSWKLNEVYYKDKSMVCKTTENRF